VYLGFVGVAGGGRPPLVALALLLLLLLLLLLRLLRLLLRLLLLLQEGLRLRSIARVICHITRATVRPLRG